MSRPLRVLITAPDCRPGTWVQVAGLAERHRVCFVTGSGNRVDLASRMAALPARMEVEFHAPGRLAHDARRLHGRKHFDLAWYCGAAPSGSVARLPIPFVWSGSDKPETGWNRLRDTVRARNPFLRATARETALALAATAEQETRLTALGCPRARRFLPAALGDAEIAALAGLPAAPPERFRVVTLATRQADDSLATAMQAFSLFRLVYPNAEHWIMGLDPGRHWPRKLAYELGVLEQVRFLPPAGEGADLGLTLERCHAVLQPSPAPDQGLSLLMAMAAGRPVVCLDEGIAHAVAPPGAGIRVTGRDPAHPIELAHALCGLAGSAEEYGRMAKAAREAARAYTIRNIARTLEAFCREALGTRKPAVHVATPREARQETFRGVTG